MVWGQAGFLAILPSHATRARLAFASVPLKYAKNLQATAKPAAFIFTPPTHLRHTADPKKSDDKTKPGALQARKVSFPPEKRNVGNRYVINVIISMRLYLPITKRV